MSLNQFGKDLLELINTDKDELSGDDFFIKYNIESVEQLEDLISQACNNSTYIDDFYTTLEKSIESSLLANGYFNLSEFINFLFEISNER